MGFGFSAVSGAVRVGILSFGKSCPLKGQELEDCFQALIISMDSSSTVYPAVIQHLHTYVTFSSLKKLLSRLSSALLCMSGALWSSLTLGGGFTKLHYVPSQIDCAEEHQQAVFSSVLQIKEEGTHPPTLLNFLSASVPHNL